MSSLTFRRVLAQSTRRNVQRTSTNLRPGLRRGMASSAGSEKSSDLPWLIGSGVVTALGVRFQFPRHLKYYWLTLFIACFPLCDDGLYFCTDKQAFYILSPRSKKHAHHAAESAKAPIENALPKEEEKPEPEMMKDDEGKEEDVSESQKIAFDTNSPKDAQAHEETVARFDGGAPGQTEEADKPEQKEKPAETKRAGTFQDKPEGPTNIGDARKEAKEHNAPKEVAEKTES
ncbi:hypothetical protein ACEPAH_9018 [Sanghuangporus vaninii]